MLVTSHWTIGPTRSGRKSDTRIGFAGGTDGESREYDYARISRTSDVPQIVLVLRSLVTAARPRCSLTVPRTSIWVTLPERNSVS